jgi:hypothetical protein
MTSAIKVESDIITSTTASLSGRAVILIIMYVENFKLTIFCLAATSSAIDIILTKLVIYTDNIFL